MGKEKMLQKIITKIPKITTEWESSEFRNWDSEHSEN